MAPTFLCVKAQVLPAVHKALHTLPCPFPALPSSLSPPRSLFWSHTGHPPCSSNTQVQSCLGALARAVPSSQENPLLPNIHTACSLSSFKSLLKCHQCLNFTMRSL
uniref:PRO0398 n=1 Tax=Homo sapiens TaxID=9606 RepID=Q9P1P1_HUMAN|nr:PRO0398 [Homo sapiens]